MVTSTTSKPDAQLLKKQLEGLSNEQKTKLGLVCSQCGDETGYGIKGYLVICATCANDNNLEGEPRKDEEEDQDE